MAGLIEGLVPDESKMNILIVKLSAIGDVIHTLPALNALRERYPDARITWLVEEDASEIIEGHAAVDRVLVSKRKRWVKGIRGSSCLQNIKEMYDFVKALRDTQYDLILDFQGLLKSGLLIGLAKGKRKVGFDRGMEHMEYSFLFLNERVPAVDMDHHAIERSMMFLEGLGISSDGILYNLPVRERDRIAADEVLVRHGVKEFEKLVAINPVAKWKTKLWDDSRFAGLADSLIKEYSCSVMFTGSRSDHKTIHLIMSQMQGKAANLAGETTLLTLSALCEKADLVVSTDTGPMHLAAALGTPVVALFGPTAPWRTGPFGHGHKIIRSGVECSPCFKRKCRKVECMKNISVQQVLAGIRELGVLG